MSYDTASEAVIAVALVVLSIAVGVTVDRLWHDPSRADHACPGITSLRPGMTITLSCPARPTQSSAP